MSLGDITPSNTSKWLGHREEGQRFTVQQLHTMKVRAPRRPVEAWEARTVRLRVPRPRTAEEVKWMRRPEECVDEIDVECPIISRGADKDWVISLGGDVVGVTSERKRK